MLVLGRKNKEIAFCSIADSTLHTESTAYNYFFYNLYLHHV